MKTWFIGTNSLYKTASVYLEEGSWWAFWGRDLSQIICGFIPPIPFPKIGRIVDDEGEVYNWRTWFGDLSQWWHVYIDTNLYDWFSRFIKFKSIEIEYKLALKLKRKSKKI